MRSLWTAASGMKTQQATIDSISNNLANVNTTGFKKERLEFKSLLYEMLKEAGDIKKGGGPVNFQVGHGVQAVASVKSFSQGTFQRTEGMLDFAIDGQGFFTVRNMEGKEVYSRDGAFKVSLFEGDLMLTNSNGQPIIGVDGEPLILKDNVSVSQLEIDEFGKFSLLKDGKKIDLGLQMKIVQFKNAQGLQSIGGGIYEQTVASGDPMLEAEEATLTPSMVLQGGLEGSNVQAVEEMVKLIVAQRAYELSSKAVQTSDEMLARANELKR